MNQAVFFAYLAFFPWTVSQTNGPGFQKVHYQHSVVEQDKMNLRFLSVAAGVILGGLKALELVASYCELVRDKLTGYIPWLGRGEESC
jgi:hypothetical protein